MRNMQKNYIKECGAGSAGRAWAAYVGCDE